MPWAELRGIPAPYLTTCLIILLMSWFIYIAVTYLDLDLFGYCLKYILRDLLNIPVFVCYFSQGEFVDDGTETHFSLPDSSFSACIKAVSSGKRREGIIHTLIIEGNQVPETDE